jgi:hypothetical protein
MGFHGRFAQQQSETTNVRFGSKATFLALWLMSALPPKADYITAGNRRRLQEPEVPVDLA